MNISRFFIDRPIFAGVLSVVVLLAGLLAMFQLPIAEYPEVVPPSVVVRAQYPGANPKVIAETVASPLEEAIKLFEEGTRLSEECQKHLSEAEGKVEILIKQRDAAMKRAPFPPAE